MNNLINRDMARCNDWKCPIGHFCCRYLQMKIDREKGEKQVSVTDFNGRSGEVCNHFINVEFKEI